MPVKRSTSVVLDDASADGTLSGTAAGALLRTVRTATVNPYQHLREEYYGRQVDDDQMDDEEPAVPETLDQPHDFYSAHAHLVVAPSQRAEFYAKRDTGNSGTASPSAASPTAASSPKSEASTTTPPLQHEQIYPLRFPQSLYGPYGERLPKITPQQLNHPQTALHPTAPTPSTVTPFGSTTHFPGSKRGQGNRSGATLLDTVSSMAGGHMTLNVEERTLSQLAEASLTAASTRNFGAEWNQALSMGIGSLSMIAARQDKLRTIAVAFSEVVAPIACAIVESRNQAPSQRPYRPLPSLDNVYIVKGHVYVVSESAARVKLFGSHEAAGRAANNEIRAVKTILGNPFLGVQTPLSCVVAFMGQRVFVSVPISLPSDPEQSLLYGAFRPDRVAVSSGAIYPAYKMSEYLPLLRHSIPNKALFAGPSPVPEAKRGIVTPCDLKLVYDADVGSICVLDAARYIPPSVCQTVEFSKAKVKEDGLGPKGVSRHPLENEGAAHLSVLFRPEFMFSTCPIQLNADANTPHQPQNSQEPISHAIHTLYSSNCWHLATDLVQAEQNKALPLSEIASMFHRHGVNLRYIGKVYSDIDAAVKTNEAREAVKKKLALEASCRAFKSIVYNRLHQEIKHRGEEALIISMFRSFLYCNESQSEAFWEDVIRPTMECKFGFYKRVVQQGSADSQNDDVRSSLLNDGSALNIYRCLKSVKRRVEHVTPTLNWKDIGGGFVSLDEEGIERLRRQSEDALSILYPLLGRNAKENSDLLIRAQQLIGVDIASDLRGKKIIVSFKPKVKPSIPCALSSAMQAVVDNGPKDVQLVLGMRSESRALCEAVEQACKAEMAAIGRISESDPRATLPLRLLSLSFSGRGVNQHAYTAISKCFELRKNVPLDSVVGGSSIEFAHAFLKAQSLDRAETLCVDGLISIRNSTSGIDLLGFVQALIEMAEIASTSLVESSGKPNLDRVIRVLEYLTYAVFLCDRYQLPLGVRALSLMASVRKKLAGGMSCFRCHRQAELVAKGDCDGAAIEKLAINDKDAASVGSKAITSTTAAAQSQAQSRGRPVNAANRRKRGEETRKGDDDDIAEVFAKKSIERIQTLYLDYVFGGGAPLHLTAALGVPSTPGSPSNSTTQQLHRSASVADIAALAHGTPSAAPDQEVPIPTILQEIQLPRVVCKAARYMCRTCSAKHPSAEKEPIMKEPALLFSKLATIALQHMPAHASFDKNIVGDALLSVGTMETDPAAVAAAVAQLSATYGGDSRVVIAASIQLADVLLETVNAAAPVSAGTTTVLVPGNNTTVSSNNVNASNSVTITQQQATVGVAQAETVLQEALAKLLGRSDATQSFATELNTVVYKLQDIARIYSLHPVAKKEHAAAHYLTEVLPPALGIQHPLVGAAYNATKHYYVQLAKKRHDRVAASNALQTAGQFANLAIRSRVESPEYDDELDSLLTVMADDILKVLRASGSATDRKASEELFSVCKQTVMDSQYRTSSTLLHRIAIMEEIFKAQLKVMEHSESLSRLSTRLDDAKKDMLRLVKSIKRHRNRVDLYGHQCLDAITQIRDEMIRSCKGVSEAFVLDKLDELKQLHVTLTKLPEHGVGGEHGEDGGLLDAGSGGGTEWTAVLGGVAKNPLAQGGGEEGGDPSLNANKASMVNNTKASRMYTSPYAILGGAPSEVDEDQDEYSGSPGGTKQARSATKHSGATSTTRYSRGGGTRPPALSPAALHYLETISERPSTQGQAGMKRPETVDRLASLIPKLGNSAVAKNHNPVRSYAQQVQKASSASLAATIQASKSNSNM